MDISTPQDLVKDSAAISLLTHTRKFRWIPTIMDRALGKTPNNAALGLDGRIAMQQGIYGRASDRLGYYFCIPR